MKADKGCTTGHVTAMGIWDSVLLVLTGPKVLAGTCLRILPVSRQ